LAGFCAHAGPTPAVGVYDHPAQGLGRTLLLDAIRRAHQSEIAGVAIVEVELYSGANATFWARDVAFGAR